MHDSTNITIIINLIFVDHTKKILPAFGPDKVDENGLYMAKFNQSIDFGIPNAIIDGTISQIEFAVTIQDRFYSSSSSDAQMFVNLFDKGTRDFILLIV